MRWRVIVRRQNEAVARPDGETIRLTNGRWQHSEGMIMLVLSRKKNESIVINNDITIVVGEIRGDKVRLGVEAPKEVPVHRQEVYEAIKRNEQMQEKATAEADATGAGGDK